MESLLIIMIVLYVVRAVGALTEERFHTARLDAERHPGHFWTFLDDTT